MDNYGNGDQLWEMKVSPQARKKTILASKGSHLRNKRKIKSGFHSLA
ncbi:hypothetical protein MED121_20191 [Marinomonas sp. MED121]|nr:hypothetical protein MED121_20191 [Marinomonas sp. MED121]